MKALGIAFFVLLIGVCVMVPRASLANSGALVTAEMLYNFCSESNPDNNVTACHAYIMGVLDYHTLMKSIKLTPGVDFCLPPSYKMEVLQVIVSEYIKDNPQNADFLAAPIVGMALSNSFPCEGAN